MPEAIREDFEAVGGYPIDVLGVRITEDEGAVEDESVNGGGEKGLVGSESRSELPS